MRIARVAEDPGLRTPAHDDDIEHPRHENDGRQGNDGACTVAAVQMTSTAEVGENLAAAGEHVAAAAAAGARLVALPENFALLGMRERDAVEIAEPPGDGPVQAFLAEQAARHRVWLVGGTLPLRAPEPDRYRAACLLHDDRGRVVARYDKIHLFDVDVADGRREYRESRSVSAGERVVVHSTPFGRVGLAVCYDVRFPELFRALLARGMEILVLPSAFTAVTGAAHWETLVRARAIENLCHVVAPAQWGRHANGRETHGDSMVVDAWGRVLARLPEGTGVVSARVDLGHLRRVRDEFPATSHIRLGPGSLATESNDSRHEQIPGDRTQAHPRARRAG